MGGMRLNLASAATQWQTFPGNTGLQRSSKSALLEITTVGIGRTRFSYEEAGDVVPLNVIFEDGSMLRRRPKSNVWTFVKDAEQVPWCGDVYVTDQEAIISAGAVVDVFKLDGSQIRYLDNKIVLLVTMCGDVFEFDYIDKMLREVRLDGRPYIQWRKGNWQLVGTQTPVHGIPEVSVHGFIFDARDKHGYFDKFLTNGNLTTMREGRCKFTFGAART